MSKPRSKLRSKTLSSTRFTLKRSNPEIWKRGRIIFITGGVRSGKSRLAVEMAESYGKNVVFLATCEAKDSEMERRIELHKESRPKIWQTIEEPLDLASAFKKIPNTTDAVIVDCLTLLVTNLVLSGKNDDTIIKHIENSVDSIKNSDLTVIFVTNEVGMGIVPDNELARNFRDTAGKINQLVARASDEAYLMVSGLKLKLVP